MQVVLSEIPIRLTPLPPATSHAFSCLLRPHTLHHPLDITKHHSLHKRMMYHMVTMFSKLTRARNPASFDFLTVGPTTPHAPQRANATTPSRLWHFWRRFGAHLSTACRRHVPADRPALPGITRNAGLGRGVRPASLASAQCPGLFRLALVECPDSCLSDELGRKTLLA